MRVYFGKSTNQSYASIVICFIKIAFLWIEVITPSDHEAGYVPFMKIKLNSLNNREDMHLKISSVNPSMPGLLFDFKERMTFRSSSSEKGQSNISFELSPKFSSNMAALLFSV